jgi:hypothetical protein
MTNPFAEAMRLINGYQVSQALHVVAVLGIADLLRDQPRTSDDLARAAGAHPDTLYRLLRAVAAVGVLQESAGRMFALTPVGACFRSDAARPASPWAEFVGRPYIWQAWSSLLHTVRTGENAFAAVHGSTVWDYRAAHPEEGALFDAAMTGLSQDVAAAVIDVYDFSPFSHVVDVGGGRGALLGAILAARPALRGTLFDQAGVVAHAGAVLARLGVADRCTVAAGDFFQEVPAGDLLLLKGILHDWDDVAAGAILQTCRRKVAASGKILVIERVLAGPNEGQDAKFADLNMLVGPGGRERSKAEFEAVFASAGLVLTRIFSTSTRMMLVEAECA